MSRKPAHIPLQRAPGPAAARRPAPGYERKIHFLLTDAYLAVANSGKPMTRLGLEALCLIGRGANDLMKQRRAGAGYPPASMDQLQVIRERWLEAFELNPDRTSRNAAREAELAASLSDDLFFQLMQNANDASAAALGDGSAMMPGKGGRGFRSVLSLTDQPRVHSGRISFTFDPAQARKALKKRLGRQTPTDMPVLRLPFPFAAKDEPGPVRELIAQYETVIVIPFRSLRACERCRAGWEKAVDDMSLLKRLPAINLMIWERDDAITQYKRTIRDNVDRRLRPASPSRKPASVALSVGNRTSGLKPAARRTPTITASSLTVRKGAAKPPPRLKLKLRAGVVPHIEEKPAPARKRAKKSNGAAASKNTKAGKARNTTNGSTASKSKSKSAKKAATKKPAARSKQAGKTKTASAKKPAGRKARAKPGGARAGKTKKSTKS